ncbi:MAG: energy-coupling factor transporter transmembrane protein EcfT [Desulfobacterales bacterium]|nr:energy-coupling factor transporter transmembrane protein EcfT [Desulfobacterales bacterium]
MKKLDPRTKLLLGLITIAAVFIAQTPVTLILEGAIIIILLFLLETRSKLLQIMHLVFPLVVLIAIVSFLSFDRPAAFLISMRLFNLLSVSFIFFHLISPDEIGIALRKIGVPYAFVFILTTSLRYVPMMRQKIRHIMDAQRSRGIDLRPKLKNAANFFSLLMPLLVQSFLLSDELAMAMELRGFNRQNRSSRRQYRLQWMDYLLMITLLSLFGVFICWERGVF